MVQKVFFNRLEREENRQVADLSGREIAVLSPLLILMVVIGVYPTPLMQRMEPSVRAVLERVESANPDLGLAELGVRAEATPPAPLGAPSGPALLDVDPSPWVPPGAIAAGPATPTDLLDSDPAPLAAPIPGVAWTDDED